jgi:LmbE family N-acetylglucosaminyl deacetylase
MRKIIVISAHPDDETLGVGGTLIKHKEAGDEIYWLIVTNVFEEFGFTKERVESRQDEIKKVTEAFGFESVFKLDFPTMQLTDRELNLIIPLISDIFKKIEPETVYVMNRSDAHSDHRIVFDAVMACTKSFRYPFIKRVLMYECISETEFAPALFERVFIPNYFVDISGYLERKLEIMSIFKSEIEVHPFPRSFDNIKALAHFRGATSGVKYAEAFQVIRMIEK